MLIELNLDERVISKIKEILESGEYENEKEVIVRAIDNLYERTKSVFDKVEPPTEKQLVYLKKLGHDGPAPSTRIEASKVIEETVHSNPLLTSDVDLKNFAHVSRIWRDSLDDTSDYYWKKKTGELELPEETTIPKYPKLPELNELDEAEKFKEQELLDKLCGKYFKLGNGW